MKANQSAKSARLAILQAEIEQLRQGERQAFAYVREKINQMLAVIDLGPLRPEELQDDALLELDPIGILSDSLAQNLEYLRETNQWLTIATGHTQAIFDSAGIGLLVVDAGGQLQGINKKGEEIFFSGGAQALLAMDFLNSESVADRSAIRCLIDLVTATGQSHNENEFAWQGRHYHVTASPIHDLQGNLGQVSLVFVDITALKQAEASLRESEFRFRDILENASDLVQSVSAEGRMLYANRAWRETLGYREEEVSQLTLNDIIHPDCIEYCLRQCQRLFEGEDAGRMEATFRTREGRAIVVEGSVNCFYHEGKPVSTRGIFRDITERKKAEARIEQLAFYDQLTQLPNRTLLQERLRQVLAQAAREHQQAAVLFIDLDHFKGINDSLGHSSGDQLLQVTAERLKNSIRNCDTVARLGGDEFVLLLTGLRDGGWDISTKLQELLQTIAAPVQLGAQEVFTTGSIGLAIYPTDGEDAESLLKNADTAMYRAKAEGRNTFRFYRPDMNSRSLERLLLRNDLHRALERGEFFLLYHPQIDVRTGAIVGLEALVRWNHPDLEVLSPHLFIPLAEEAGMILPLGEWVLRQATQQLAAWRRAGLQPGRLCVNLSGCEFRRYQLGETVEKILLEADLDPGLLELEITEGSFMEDVGGDLSNLQRIKKLGITLALDNFGTGSSSLGQLKISPVDRLKIDPTFIQTIGTEADGGAIAAAIAALTGLLGVEVVAEGVESRAQRDFLTAHGCFVMQGFYFFPPLPAAEIPQLLRRQGGFSPS
ncbi:MAG: EAL domain-containing protein, partial [Desulfuromonadales bacterium]|nr:EAL domain-containing protein [Desulfuromonadales bacterium]